MRKSLVFLLLLVLLAALLSAAQADLSEHKWQRFETGCQAVIYDAAGLLADGEAEEVLDSMKPITNHANVAFVTYRELGNTSGTVLNKAKAWGNKRFGNASAYIVFMIDMTTRRLGIYSSSKVYGVLTTAKANSITDNVYKLASNGEYADCAKAAFAQINRVLGGEKISQPMKYVSNAFLALICAILMTYMFLAGRMRSEQATTMQTLTRAAGVGAATAVTAHVLKKVVHHQSSSGGRGGFGGGGGHFGGGGGGGSHGF